MSKDAMEQIIGRLVLDPEFRQQMVASRDQALAGYALTQEQRAALAGLDMSDLEAAAALLDERVSKGLQAN